MPFVQGKKRGRHKGSKNKLSLQITRKLGDATLHYAHGRYKEVCFISKTLSNLIKVLGDIEY